MADRTVRVRCVVQARTDSMRLPGKSLLPIAGVPLAVLVALRAANTGLDVVLATSDRAVDDELARLAGAWDISVVRGSATDVRGRIVNATRNMSDEDIVVRLTADNVVPDGRLIQALLDEFTVHGPLIAGLGSGVRKLPYGLAPEAMKVGSLRESCLWRDDAYAKEHVTTTLWDREPRRGSDVRHPDGNLGHLRCTIDTIDDYLRVLRLFRPSDDPVGILWTDLVSRLAVLPEVPIRFSPGPGLTIGTAQLSDPYGSVQKTTPPSREAAIQMLRRGIENGAQIDTAAAYGGAERIVGEALEGGWAYLTQVVTKLDPMPSVGVEDSQEVAVQTARASVFRSVALLGREVQPTLLLHRSHHRLSWNGAVWQALVDCRDNGWVHRLGVSVKDPQELLEVLEDGEVAAVQISCNVLDRRWYQDDVVSAIERRPDVEVQARGAFLQGILVRDATAWPSMRGVDPLAIIEVLDSLVADLGRMDRADLCLAWLRARSRHAPRIDRVIVGMESPEQLEQNLQYWSQSGLNDAEVEECESRIPPVPEDLLDPAKWPQP